MKYLLYYDFVLRQIWYHTRCWFLVYIGERWKRKGKSTKNSETCLMSQRYLNWNFLPKSLLWVFLLVYSLQGLTIFFKHSTWAVIVVSIRLKFHALGITYAVFLITIFFTWTVSIICEINYCNMSWLSFDTQAKCFFIT